MSENKFCLSSTDMTAIELDDSNYINNKGANRYLDENYAESAEYYRLAAAMGNSQAISNLGYCYLYGRSIEPNLSLAVAYFKVAAARKNVDAAYKLGDIYSRDKWGIKDPEMSVYYYRMAASYVVGSDWDNERHILWCDELLKYPSLCFALGRELTSGENMLKDVDSAYQFLRLAEKGYKAELANGAAMYQQSYNEVCSLLQDKVFNEVRYKYDDFDEEDDI